MCYVKHKMKMNDHLWQFNISSVEKKNKMKEVALF